LDRFDLDEQPLVVSPPQGYGILVHFPTDRRRRMPNRKSSSKRELINTGTDKRYVRRDEKGAVQRIR
jgi:hypothetical protein